MQQDEDEQRLSDLETALLEYVGLYGLSDKARRVLSVKLAASLDYQPKSENNP